MTQRSHRPFLLCLAAAALAAACSKSESAGEAKRPPRPALVEVAEVTDGKLTHGWTFLGQVEPALSAEIAAAVGGHLLAVNVREGDRVEAKQVLATLDSARIRASLAAARAKEKGLAAELELAEKQLKRIEKLQYPTVSEPERERFQLTAQTLRAQLATQRAETRRIQVEYAQHIVKAPFGGVVRARHVDPGTWVNVGQRLLEVVSLDEIEVHVDVSAELGGRLEAGHKAKLVGNSEVAADIVGVVPALDADTRTMRVRLVPTERPKWLIAGMAIDVEFAVTFAGEGVTVPRDALLRGPVDVRVVKLVDGHGVSVKVEVLATAKASALVRAEELRAGDKVVVRGNERLRPGQPLEVRQ
jgi:RND family efflux transporter MFP subunit